MFPVYYGSPFVFKMKSLGSTMEYYYSVSGTVLNVVIWSILIAIVRYAILTLSEKVRKNITYKIIYKTLVGALLVFSFLNISVAYLGLGKGFNENLNYWHWNLNQEANDWGVKCDGEWKFCIK